MSYGNVNAGTHAFFMDIRQFVASHPAVAFPQEGTGDASAQNLVRRGRPSIVAPDSTQR
jgi:hypothetical protein